MRPFVAQVFNIADPAMVTTKWLKEEISKADAKTLASALLAAVDEKNGDGTAKAIADATIGNMQESASS